MIVLIASGYVSIFIAIGLMVSAGTRESRVSLVVLLLIWVSLVVFVPSTLGTLATKWMPYVQSVDQFNTAKQIALEPIDTDYVNRLQAHKEQQHKPGNVSSKLTQLLKTSPEKFEGLARLEYERVDDKELFLKAERVNEEVDIRERLNREYLMAQIGQVQSARAITRLSPAAIVQYALESMAGTGLNRHLQFLEGVHRHIRQFRKFIVDMDKADTESLHLIGIPEGMSKNPISPRAIPTYEDKITFRETFNAAMVDMLLLVFLFCMFIFGAFLVFIHSEV